MLSKNTVSKMLSRFSKQAVPTFYSSIEKIGGPGIIVEIDESKFGKVEYHRGHRVDGVWVFGMVERTGATLNSYCSARQDSKYSFSITATLCKGRDYNF